MLSFADLHATVKLNLRKAEAPEQGQKLPGGWEMLYLQVQMAMRWGGSDHRSLILGAWHTPGDILEHTVGADALG